MNNANMAAMIDDNDEIPVVLYNVSCWEGKGLVIPCLCVLQSTRYIGLLPNKANK